MAKILFTFAILFQLLANEAAAGIPGAPYCRHFYARTYRISDVITNSYMPIDFGYNDISSGFIKGQRVIYLIEPSTYEYNYPKRFGEPRVINFQSAGISAKFMPGVHPLMGGSHYFSVETNTPNHFLPHIELLTDPEVMARYREGKVIYTKKMDRNKMPQTGPLLSQLSYEFFNSLDLAHIEKLVSYELTWKTYLDAGTVTQKDIKSFAVTEAGLDPRRKITFELSVPEVIDGKMKKKTLGLMRVYDGSPFPTTAFSDMPNHHEAIKTDPRVPVERRYPQINFRKNTEYIFEPGRLAKSPELEGNLMEYQFHQLAKYLHYKFGFKSLAPSTYWTKGQVVIEITGRNLEKFMRARKKNGMGFTLDYIVESTPDGEKKTEVSKNATYESLKLSFEETKTKYLLHSTISDFIDNFGAEKEGGY